MDLDFRISAKGLNAQGHLFGEAGHSGLARAAGKLGHIQGEGLRTQFEPFGHDEIGHEHIGEISDRHPFPDGQCSGRDDFARLGGEDLGAEESAARLFRHELDESSGVEVGECPGDVVQAKLAALRLDALCAGLGFGETDRRHLGIGEDHGWHRREVERGIAAQHVDGGPGPPGCRHINELRDIRAVAGRVHVLDCGSQVIIDPDRAIALGLDPDGFQSKLLGIGPAPGCDQKTVSANAFTAEIHAELAGHK